MLVRLLAFDLIRFARLKVRSIIHIQIDITVMQTFLSTGELCHTEQFA